MPTFKTRYQNPIRIRADKFLADQLPDLTRTDVQRWIASGSLRVNDQVTSESAHLLVAGDRVEFSYEPVNLLAPRAGELVTKYEDAGFLVVEKPAGLPVYATAKRQPDALLNILLSKYPEIRQVGEPDRPGIVHRLDKQTSGLLVVAKTPEAFAHLKKVFASREIYKEYLALVYGQLTAQGVIDKALTKIGQFGRSKVRVDVQGKTARTEYWPIAQFGVGLDQFTLLRVKLHTGRTHQIRVHLAFIGHPVMGDDLYGKPESQKLKEFLHRQFLHASKLEFKLSDGSWVAVESKLPEDLQEVIQKLKIKNQNDS